MSRSFRLGLFLITTIGIFAVCVFLVGRQELKFGSNYLVRSEFDNVAGLSDGADVRVGGIRMGTVQSIQLPKGPDGKVTVSMDLSKQTQSIVRKDSVASIQSAGLLGDKYVDISFGSADAERLKGGEKIESEPPLDVADLFHKANQILDTGQGALENIVGATDNLNLITGKINSGHGSVGKLINDSTLYNQASASVTSMHDSADAMKSNFLLRGFFKNRGYTNPTEVQQHAISQLPTGQPVKSFQYDPKKLFDKPDSAKLKNQKTLNDAGQYLQGEKFGFVVITASTGRTGDSDKQQALSEARGFVVRKYLVENFSLDDTRLKTLGLGKSATANEDGSIEILVYASAPAVAAKAPAKK
jgi:phospholipid/cholesterol/gamma-HCH transport system substrate-binding protein